MQCNVKKLIWFATQVFYLLKSFYFKVALQAKMVVARKTAVKKYDFLIWWTHFYNQSYDTKE